MSLGFWEQPKVCLGLHVATSPRRGGCPRRELWEHPSHKHQPHPSPWGPVKGALGSLCVLRFQTSWVLQQPEAGQLLFRVSVVLQNRVGQGRPSSLTQHGLQANLSRVTEVPGF